jgi:hypothetical protein
MPAPLRPQQEPRSFLQEFYKSACDRQNLVPVYRHSGIYRKFETTLSKIIFLPPGVYVLKPPPPPSPGGFQLMSFGGRNVKRGREKVGNLKEKGRRGKKKR